MDWVEVPPSEWQAFLGRFSSEHKGWRAAVETHEPGSIPERLFEGMPLQMICAEAAGSEVNDIAILAGGEKSDASGGLLHRVRRPQQMRFAQSNFWNDVAVHIQPAGGPSTVLHVWTNPDRDQMSPR